MSEPCARLNARARESLHHLIQGPPGTGTYQLRRGHQIMTALSLLFPKGTSSSSKLPDTNRKTSCTALPKHLILLPSSRCVPSFGEAPGPPTEKKVVESIDAIDRIEEGAEREKVPTATTADVYQFLVLYANKVPFYSGTTIAVYNYAENSSHAPVNLPNQTVLCARQTKQSDPARLINAPCFIPNVRVFFRHSLRSGKGSVSRERLVCTCNGDARCGAVGSLPFFLSSGVIFISSSSSSSSSLEIDLGRRLLGDCCWSVC